MPGLNMPTHRQVRYDNRCHLKEIEQQNKDRVKRLEKRSELRDCIRQEVSQEISTKMNQKKKALTTHTMRSGLQYSV